MPYQGVYIIVILQCRSGIWSIEDQLQVSSLLWGKTPPHSGYMLINDNYCHLRYYIAILKCIDLVNKMCFKFILVTFYFILIICNSQNSRALCLAQYCILIVLSCRSPELYQLLFCVVYRMYIIYFGNFGIWLCCGYP